VETDVVGEAKRVVTETARRKPKIRPALESSFSIYEKWWEDMRVALAIAWTRFRARQSGHKSPS
jgi:hypothetical protein